MEICEIPESLTQRFGSWDDCLCNELQALYNRHLCQAADGAKLSEHGVKAMRKVARELAQTIGPIGRVSQKYIVDHKPSAKRAGYEQARISLLTRPLTKKDTKISMFVKNEKVLLSEVQTKEPRAIQFRPRRFNLVYATYYHPFEQALFKMDWRHTGRVVAKGLNQDGRAMRLRKMYDAHAQPACVLIDFSRFDSHVTRQHLRLEHAVTRKCCGRHGDLEFCMRSQIENSGRSKHGIRYKSSGGRMSGDQNTGGGNSVINLLQLQAWLDHSGVEGQIFLDGDDSVVIVERQDLGELDPMWLQNNIGMKVKSSVVLRFEDIEFCQCQPVEIAPGKWRMVRNPSRAISKDVVTVQKYPAKVLPKLLAAIGDCELSLNIGVPIMQEFARYLTRASSKRVALPNDMAFRAREMCAIRPGKAHPREIHPLARVSFQRAFGISVSEQLLLESWFRARVPVMPDGYFTPFDPRAVELSWVAGNGGPTPQRPAEDAQIKGNWR